MFSSVQLPVLGAIAVVLLHKSGEGRTSPSPGGFILRALRGLTAPNVHG